VLKNPHNAQNASGARRGVCVKSPAQNNHIRTEVSCLCLGIQAVSGEERNQVESSDIPGDHNTENDNRVRDYLRSTIFRVCSWSSAALLAASFFVSSRRPWLLYAAAAVSFYAMLPVLRVIPYSQRIDIHNQRDRRSLLFVGVFLALILIGGCLVVYFRSR